jgi:hypothetical protein
VNKRKIDREDSLEEVYFFNVTSNSNSFVPYYHEEDLKGFS